MNKFSALIILVVIISHGEGREYPVVILQNETDLLFNELKTSSIVIDVDPFDFIYENASVLFMKAIYGYQIIQRSPMSDLEPIDVVKRLYKTVSLNYDWIGRNLYWLQTKIIEVSDFNGYYRKTLYWKNIDEPNTMVLDPFYAYLFLSDAGRVPRIERAGMHGDTSSRDIVIRINIKHPLSLALDPDDSYLFWSDMALQVIERCNYKGKNRSTIVQLYLQTPGSLAFFNDTLFWIDNKNHTVNALLIKTNETDVIGFLRKKLLNRRVKLGSYTMYRYVRYEYFRMKFYNGHVLNGTNNGSAEQDIGVCDHLKLRAPVWPHYLCICSANYQMTTEGCVKDQLEEFSRIAVVTPAYIAECYNGSYHMKYDKPLDDFAFISSEDDIVFSSNRDIFISSYTNISEFKSLITFQRQRYIWYMDFDWIGHNLYTVDIRSGQGVISILRMKTNSEWIESTLFENVGYWFKFALDSPTGLMFISEYMSLLRSSMDGDSTTRKILFRLQHPRAGFVLSLDVVNKVVYWSALDRSHLLESSEIIRLTYEGEILPYNYQRVMTVEFMIYGIYMITAEYENQMKGVSITQCNKDFGGDCIIHCDIPHHVFRIRVYPEVRKSTGTHPCDNNSANCSDFCLISTAKPYYRCSCQIKYVLSADRRTCILPACALDNGKCSMICEDINGTTVRCSCRDGFQMTDNRTCQGDMGLTFVQGIRNGWRRTDISTNKYLDTWLEFYLDAATYDPVERKFYWTSAQDKTMRRSNLDGSEIEVVLKDIKDYSANILLEFDWISREVLWLIYFDVWRLSLNDSKTHHLPLLLHVLTDLGEHQKSSDRIDPRKMVLDVFSGNVYVLWFGSGSGALNASLEGELVHSVLVFQSHFRMDVRYKVHTGITFVVILTYATFDLDGHQNKIYAAAPQGIYVYNTDGTGGRFIDTVFSGIYAHDVVVLGEQIYFIVSNNIFIVEKDTWQYVKITSQLQKQQFYMGINLLRDNGTQNIACMEHEKCWGITNTWICLDPSQICDGTINCYDAHDEYYCSLCINNCSIVSFYLLCLENENSNSNADSIEKSQFIDWTSHALSHIISFHNILSYDCLTKFTMQSDEPNHIENFEVYSLFQFHRLRQIIMSGTLTELDDVTMVHLSGHPLLVDIDPRGLHIFENVEHLIIEETYLTTILPGTFNFSLSLRILSFHQNIFLQLNKDSFGGLYNLESLSIFGSNLPIFDGKLFNDLINLAHLNLSYNNIQILDVGLLDNQHQLQVLDIRGNDIKLTSNLFLYNINLELIYCDSFTFCCIKPASVSDVNCTAKQDDISSCTNLIGNRILSSFLWIFGIMAFVGNLSVLVYRGCVDKTILRKSYFIFIYNLGFSDLIMAVYMLIIAYHDALYDGIYVWNDYNWKRSTLCMVSGILSMVSSEASMMFVCMITLERLFCVKFAFGNLRISRKVAVYVSIALWIFSASLAVIPAQFYSTFFSRSGVCIAIPLTSNNDSGLEYATIIFLGLNFVFSVLILIGQIAIFYEVRKSSKRVQSSQQGRNLAVAKRLAVVVITDCLCWIPIGVLVMMSLRNVKTPRDIYAWVIIFVLPLNAAVNPYLYTLTDLDKKKIKKCFGCKK